MTYINRCAAFGTPCTVCSKVEDRSTSFGQRELTTFIRTIADEVFENDRLIISPRHLDIVIPHKNIAIEYNGLYWHSDKMRERNYHIDKLEHTNKKGYRLITIFEDEWLHKKEIVKTRLRHIFGVGTKKLYGRQCSIISLDAKNTRTFIDDHHIQGYGGCRYRYGLTYNNVLVAVMTFSLPSLAKGMKSPTKNIIELNRFCTSPHTVGAAGKLLKHFCKTHPEYNIIYSFADRRWSNGDLYRTLGFILDHNTKPNYWYTKGTDRIYRFALRKTSKDNQELTEVENRALQGYYRIWDCGSTRFSYTNPFYCGFGTG
jgi:hypothetical protein